MLIDVSSQCMLLIIGSRKNITALLFGRTLGYTAKLSHINMVLNFFEKNNYLLCYAYRVEPLTAMLWVSKICYSMETLKGKDYANTMPRGGRENQP